METRQKVQSPPPKRETLSLATILGFCGLGVLVLGLVAIINAASGTSSPSPAKAAEESRDKTIRATFWCGVDFDDAGHIATAVSRGDTAAIAGLLARGRAFQVEEGTRVHDAGWPDMGISTVYIESGSQVGRNCYISTNALR